MRRRPRPWSPSIDGDSGLRAFLNDAVLPPPIQAIVRDARPAMER